MTLKQPMRVRAVKEKFQLYNNGGELSIYENNYKYPFPMIINEGFIADSLCNNNQVPEFSTISTSQSGRYQLYVYFPQVAHPRDVLEFP